MFGDDAFAIGRDHAADAPVRPAVTSGSTHSGGSDADAARPAPPFFPGDADRATAGDVPVNVGPRHRSAPSTATGTGRDASADDDLLELTDVIEEGDGVPSDPGARERGAPAAAASPPDLDADLRAVELAERLERLARRLREEGAPAVGKGAGARDAFDVRLNSLLADHLARFGA